MYHPEGMTEAETQEMLEKIGETPMVLVRCRF